MKKFKFLFSIMWIIIPLFLLTSCDAVGKDTASNILKHLGDTFMWFFTKLTPSYWSNLPKIWALLGCLEGCWEIPSFIGVIVGVIMAVVIFVFVLVISLVFIVVYVALVILFFAIYIVLIVIGLIGALIAAISAGILSV